MKRVAYLSLVAASLAASSAFAAEMPVKPAPPAPAPPPWDVVLTAALMNDYIFRGITQSNHRPSMQGGFELRYNTSSTLQWYGDASGEGIDFPNQAAAEIDVYGGGRPTLGNLALDFGVWEPDGKCYNTPAFCGSSPIGGAFVLGTAIGVGGAGNVVKQDESYIEFYAKSTYTFNDQWSAGLQEWYSPSVANTGAYGWFTTGNLTFTAPSSWFPSSSSIGGYVSSDLGYWALGTSDAFYGTGIAGNPFQFRVKYTSYATWDAGVGWTYRVLTFDLRYYDTNLTKAECNVFTSTQALASRRALSRRKTPLALAPTGVARHSSPNCQPRSISIRT